MLTLKGDKIQNTCNVCTNTHLTYHFHQVFVISRSLLNGPVLIQAACIVHR